jgi:hypothetical protein
MVLICQVKEDAVEITGGAEGVDLPSPSWWRVHRMGTFGLLPQPHRVWRTLYHGEMALELWRADSRDEPLAGLLDLFDPQRAAAISFRAGHIGQPV